MRYLWLGVLLTCWVPAMAEPLTVTATLRVRSRGFRFQGPANAQVALRWQETRRGQAWMVVVQSPGEPVRSWSRGPQGAPYGELSLRSPSRGTVVTFLTLPDSPEESLQVSPDHQFDQLLKTKSGRPTQETLGL